MKRVEIRKRVKYWQDQLGLNNWNIEVFFDLKKKSSAEKNNFITAAHTDAHYQYKLGSISFDPKHLGLVDESVIVHELLHCLMFPMGGWEFKTQAEEDSFHFYNEMVTSEIERIIMRIKKK